MNPAINKLLKLMDNPGKREEVWRRGRDIATPACAATASVWLQEVGILAEGEVYKWTADLLRALIKKGWHKVSHVDEVKPGDLIASMDRNANGAPDHVFFIVDPPNKAPQFIATAVDNRHDGKPYRRNLGKGGYTPFDYALRAPQTGMLTDKQRVAMHRAYKRFKAAYADDSGLWPENVRRRFHEMMALPEWDEIRDAH